MRFSRIIWAAMTAAMLAGVTMAAGAQTPVPFLSTVAGIATGSSVTPCTGDIPTVAGTLDGDGCVPTQATLSAPSSNAIDAYGNIYISDYTHKQVRVIYQGGPALGAMLIAASPGISNFTPMAGRIYTLTGGLQGVLATTGTPKALYCNGAGSGTVAIATNGDGCPGTQGYLQPRGMAVDAYGNVFIASVGGGEGMRVVYAGGTAAQNPVFTLITTLNSTVTTPQAGYIYSITGSTTAGFSGDGANARTAKFENVRDVAVDSFGNLFISDGNTVGSITNNDIRVIYSGGAAVASLIAASYPGTTATYGFIYTIVGSKAAANACPAGSFSGDAGPAASAAIASPYAMFLDANSNLYFTDSCNGRLRVVYAAGTIPNVTAPVQGNIYTVAGGGTLPGPASGIPATQLSMTLPQSGGIDAAGNIYVADNTQRYAWQINPTTGVATLFAGLGAGVVAPAAGSFCNGTGGLKSVDTIGDGCPSLEASISPSLRLTGDTQGHLYWIDNGVLREYNDNNLFPATAATSTTTQSLAFLAPAQEADSYVLQGTSTAEFSDGGGIVCSTPPTLPASTLCVYSVTFAPAAAGVRNGAVKVSSAGVILGSELLSGVGIASQLSVDPGTPGALGTGLTPQGSAVDAKDDVFVADAKAGQLLEFKAGSATATLVATGLSHPNQVAVDGLGNLYVADTGNNRVVEEPATGGAVVALGSGLAAPQGVAVDITGNVYIADTGNNRVIQIVGGKQQVFPVTGLSAPTRLTFDSTGNLFVVDSGNSRVVQFTQATGQSVVSFGTLTVKPAGIAVDSAGDIYVADTGTQSVLELLPGAATVTNTLVTGFTTPVDVTLGPNASVYVADTAATSLTIYNRGIGLINFPITNIGDTSTEPILLANTGNAVLNFPGPQLYTGPVGNFTIAGAAANGCAVGASVAVATDCQLTATFTPTTPGTPSQSFAFITNAANTASVSALLTGTGAHLTSTTTTIKVTSPTTSTIGFGTPVVITVNVALNTNVGTPQGTITVSVDGHARPAVPYGSGTVTVPLSPAVGTHSVTAQFSGDLLYASSGSTLTFTVVQATTTTTLGISTAAPGGVPTVTFTATVASATATGETGAVTFYSGTTQLGQPINLNGATTVSYSTASITFPSSNFSAVYSGDGNFQGSTSSTVQPPPDFTLAAQTTSLGTAQGGVASGIITVTPIFSATGTVTPSCSGLPTYAVCRFQPTSVTFNGNAPTSVSINVYTDIQPSSISALRSRLVGSELAGLLPWGAGLLLLVGVGTRRRNTLGRLMLIAGLCSITLLGGCLSPVVPPKTPVGSQPVTVTFTSSGTTTTVTHALVYNFTVTQP